MNSLKRQQSQNGAVSLFVVVFATLLMIIITISFIQLMIKDQRQATASDLSQSAYDSAKSGVEDAKRLLLLDQACRSSTAPAAVNCGAVMAAVDSNLCSAVSAGLYGGALANNDETMIQQDEADESLQQAYTCVKIDAVTADYKGIVGLNQSNIIPLQGVGDFDSVTISWFTRDDVAAATNSLVVGFPSGSGPVDLPRMGSRWAVNYPSLMRAQLMQTSDSFRLSDADAANTGKSNANTLFLYPASPGDATMNFNLDIRRDQLNAPKQADCVNNFSLREYACSVTIALPEPINGSMANRNAFLRLSSLYNGSHYKVQLSRAGAPVEFDRVQPEVDSTGRANDMFRRVKSRIEFKGDFIYPEAAVDIEGDLCKNFIITNLDADYDNSSTCTP
jgi:Tfp pilus assembly protein PilX